MSVDIKGFVDYEVLDTSWLKLLVEYRCNRSRQFPSILSLRGAGAYSPDRLLSFACLAQFLLLRGFLNSFYVQFLYVALVGWPRITTGPTDPRQHIGLDKWPVNTGVPGRGV